MRPYRPQPGSRALRPKVMHNAAPMNMICSTYTCFMRRFEPDCGRRNLNRSEIQLNGVCFNPLKPGPADCEAGFCFLHT
jgi:hypothetical protein